MASTSLRPEVRSPRGLTVWCGLDPFGASVVRRLSRWLTDDRAGAELAAANRLLPDLALPIENDPAPEGTVGFTPAAFDGAIDPPPNPPYDAAAEAIQGALGELLAGQSSRHALAASARDLLVPHVWLVADADGPDVARLASWSRQLHRRLAELQVEARVYVLLRNRSWARTPTAQIELVRRMRELVETAASEHSQGRGKTMVFVVSDRDGIGGRYDDDDTVGLVFRFTDAVMLGDLPHERLSGAARAFVAPFGSDAADWVRVPVFASVAGVAFHWDAPALFRRTAEQRQQRLVAALQEPGPPTFDPPHPELRPIKLASARWPNQGLPRWSPRFWRSARHEFERSQAIVERWTVDAERWRLAMLVTYEDRRANVEHHAAATLRAYVADLDDATRSVLDDDSVPGYFAPLRRLHERAAADLRVREADLRRLPRGTPAPDGDKPFDPTEALPPPASVSASSEAVLVRRLERKINPLLLAQVAILTFLMICGWTIYAAHWVDGWRDDGHTPDRGSSVFDRLHDWIDAAGHDLILRVQDWQPSEVQVAVWVGLAAGLLIAALAAAIALRQRVLLERSWKVYHDRCRRWRDAGRASLIAHLAATEFALAQRNIAAAADEVADRGDRLDAVRSAGLTALDGASAPPDLAVSERVLPAKPPPPPLTDLQVVQIVSAFRKVRRDDPRLLDPPAVVLGGLFREAGRIAGDPEPDLLHELPLLSRRIQEAIPPIGAVRVQQFGGVVAAEHSPPAVLRVVAAPAHVSSQLAIDDAIVLPVPVDDRFYALTIQTGMAAVRVFGVAPKAEPVIAGATAHALGLVERDVPGPEAPAERLDERIDDAILVGRAVPSLAATDSGE